MDRQEPRHLADSVPTTLLRLLSLVNINESRLQPLCRRACNPSRGSVHSRPTFHFVIALRDELPSRNVIPTIITITFNIIANHRALAAVLRNVRFEGHAMSLAIVERTGKIVGKQIRACTFIRNEGRFRDPRGFPRLRGALHAFLNAFRSRSKPILRSPLELRFAERPGV